MSDPMIQALPASLPIAVMIPAIWWGMLWLLESSRSKRRINEINAAARAEEIKVGVLVEASEAKVRQAIAEAEINRLLREREPLIRNVIAAEAEIAAHRTVYPLPSLKIFIKARHSGFVMDGAKRFTVDTWALESEGYYDESVGYEENCKAHLMSRFNQWRMRK